MMAARLTVLGLIIARLLAGVYCADEPNCTEETKGNCTEPLKKYTVTDDSNIVPNYPVKQMREICQVYEGVKACMRGFEHKCDIADRKWFQGVHDSYRYICDDHFSEYEIYRDCLATPELHKEGRACNWTLHFSFDSDIYRTSNSSYKAKRICQYAKTYLNCVENLVHSFCGEEAATWQRGFDESSLDPLLSAIGCTLSGKTSALSQQTTIVIGVTITLIIVMVFVFCGIAMWVYSKKKHAADARNSVARANGTTRGAAVYRVEGPGAEGDVSVSPYAYSTPSPVPPPYAEKPPDYSLPNGTEYATANGNAFHPAADGATAANLDAPALDVKLPLPPDYEASPTLPSPPASVEMTRTPAAGDSDYLALQTPPASPSQDESGYSSIGDVEGQTATAPTTNNWVQFPDVRPQMPLPDNSTEGQ